LNLLKAEVSYASSNLNEKIIQMQQPTIHLYLAESSLVHRGELPTSGWYPSLMGVLISLNSLSKRPSILRRTFLIEVFDERANCHP
jgi:hypothetical protein